MAAAVVLAAVAGVALTFVARAAFRGNDLVLNLAALVAAVGYATLGALAGKTLLVVNVASKCGLTPQYTALEELHARLSPRGFAVVGFPCNQFAAQEPGGDAAVAAQVRVVHGGLLLGQSQVGAGLGL